MSLIARAQGANEAELSAHLKANPADLRAARALAELKLVAADSDFYEPLINLITSSDEETGEETGKLAQKALIDLIQMLPPDDHRIAPARRRLASALYR